MSRLINWILVILTVVILVLIWQTYQGWQAQDHLTHSLQQIYRSPNQ